MLALGGCAATSPGQQPVPPRNAHRIVSLVPSLTEDLCAIGAGKQLVGVSEFSGDIACARGLPAVNNFASVDTEEVVRLHPDAVVGIPSQRAMTAPLRRAGIPTVLLKDDSYRNLLEDIGALGALTGRSERARSEVAALQQRTRELRADERFKRRPTVFFVPQALPIWTAGPQSYIATLIDLAGGKIATAGLPQPYAQYSTEALVRLNPDAIVATSDAHLEPLLGRQPWRSLRAVREHHVYILHDAALLVRPGPRYNEGLSWLIERLRPLAT